MAKVENPPLVHRTAEAYRDTGYDLETSVADLVDNAVGAGQAKRIRIALELSQDGGDLSFSIVDDGVGMDENTLKKAMAVGSSEELLKHELSKFGHGMKTASWAHSKRLVVVTRSEGNEPISAIWDLEHVIKSSKWEMEIPEKVNRKYLEELDDLVSGKSGTLVAWEGIDRLLTGYKDPAGQPRKKALKKMVEQTKDHLAMVFHRYLDPAYEEVNTVEIWINEEPVRPWDPFAQKFQDYEVRELQQTLMSPGRDKIDVRAYLLPREDEWGFDDDYSLAIRKASELQGFYLYRANRVIMEPTWLGMIKQEPHSNLARVRIDLNPSWDDVLHVDFKKSTVQFSDSQKDELRSVMTRIVKMAKDQRSQSPEKQNSAHSHSGSDRAISKNKTNFTSARIETIDSEKQTATVTTKLGKLSGLRVIEPSKQQTVNIIVRDEGIADGKLWESVVTRDENGTPGTALALNAHHEFYKRVYLPASHNEVGKKAMDLLLWSIMNAETNTTNDQNRQLFEDLRYEMSRTLRRLANELPEFDPIED